MKFLKFFLIFCLFNTVSFAIDIDKINSTMEKNINKALQILQTPQENMEQKAKKIFPILDSIFDWTLMSKLSLSKEYEKLSLQDQKLFVQTFENNIKKNFTDKLHLYKDQTLKIENGEQIKKNRYILKTSLLANNEHHDIIFKFYDDNGNWKIYDVDIAGISLIQTYRSQFLDILKYKNFATLIEKLKDGISIDAE